MNNNIKMILTKDELRRVKARINNGQSEITVDLHSMHLKEARRLLNNLIAVDRQCSELHVIHGYNHGTAIKDMIANDLFSPRILNKSVRKDNPGLTDILLSVA